MSNYPGYTPAPDGEPPSVLPFPVVPSQIPPDFERAAFQDVKRFHALGRLDTAVSAVTFGSDNLRMNYALLGLLLGGLLMFAVWWMITE